MDIKSVKVLSLAIALGALGMSAQSAVADEDRFYIAPGVQWMDFDSARQSDDEFGYTVGLGYGLSDNLALELNHANIKMNTLAGMERLRSIRLDAVYKLDNSVGVLSPYFVTGLGHTHFYSDDDTTLNAGAGLTYRFNDRVEWRTSARTFYGFDDGTYDFGIDTGLVFHLGESRAAAPVGPTPAPATPPAVVDSDGDGVPDSRDACPDTPRTYAVDDRGCPIMIEEVARIELNVEFAFDSAEVPAAYFDEIRRVADFMEEHDDTVAALGGHTDNIGAEEYNQDLSARRAAAVRQVLIDRFGISAARITSSGYGESQPVANNATADGRERNRRVESVLSSTEQRPQLRD
ncbi:MAG: OmpA family protein [Pseudohongiella sp.]|uniref:OmpA family protein n=1 Tax=Pseudohongiella sp. TaxID=1979412 RepID=UPI0034A03004